jgi:hypothetical protein
MKYFTNTIDYPNNITDNLLPYNEMWGYVSSTFLNGFINYVDVIQCHVLDKYVDEENYEYYEDNICECSYRESNSASQEWKKFKGPKSELLKNVIDGKFCFSHTKLNCFMDDIIILGKIKSDDESTNKYMFFWFDCDVSNCAVGRFETTDSEEQVLEELKLYLKERVSDNYIKGYTLLPDSFIEGWVSF